MTKLEWGTDRRYEAGVDRGVLYLENSPGEWLGVAWNGITSVDESPVGGEIKKFYFDGFMYLLTSESEEFEATINAFYSPPEFDACEGYQPMTPGFVATQQPREMFGLSYRTKIGSDQNTNLGYKIHLVYNAFAEPTQKTHQTLGENIETTDLSWNLAASPIIFPGMGPSAHYIINSTEVDPVSLDALEQILYGNDEQQARLPWPDEIAALFITPPTLIVTDLGDGTYSVEGPDSAITSTTNTFQVIWDSAFPLDDDTFVISSL